MNRLTRKVHYWLGIVIAIPLFIVVSTGLLLQLKKQIGWVQPPEVKSPAKSLTVTFDEMARQLRSDASLGFSSWDDVSRVDIRPKKGLAKVVLKSGVEVQMDTETGRILQKEVRRSDLIESLHDGSFFAGDLSKLGVFLPAGIALFLMLISGLWLWWLPIKVRRQKAKKLKSSND